MQPDVMFPNDPVESREQMLRDNCDQIEQRSFTRSFSQDEVYARRAELEQVSIQVAELEDELAQIRADIKGRIKPLLERQRNIIQATRFFNRTGTDD